MKQKDSLITSGILEVEAGQEIGNVGLTGNTSGPHLHFEIWYNGTPVNPEDFVSF